MTETTVSQKELDNLVDRLMLADLRIVTTGNHGRFWAFAVPVEGIQGDRLRPGSPRQLNFKNPFQETPLFERNFRTVLSCNRRRLVHYIKIKNPVYCQQTPTRRGHYTPSLVHWHELLVVFVTHPIVPLKEEISTLPIPI